VKLQSWKKALLTGIVVSLLASAGCQSNQTDDYAKQLKLPREVRTTVRQLEYDTTTWLLLNELSKLPKDLQTHETTLNYLKEISADKMVSYDEVYRIAGLDHDGDGLTLEEETGLKTDPLQPNPEIKKVVDYLESVSDETLDMYKTFGIDGNVVSYINLVSTLPKGFSDYVIKSKLCIQDKRLTVDEKQFLQDPDTYLQEIYEYNISEIAAIDPELAIKLKQIPFLQDGIELKDVESLEDILYLASNPENQPKLEKIYGKGIERKMWPVALERVFYKGFENELDVDNPFEGSEWYVNSNLAEFQEKYNTEMDQDGVSGTKPRIKGISYDWESLGYLIKGDYLDYYVDFALIRWVLRCNAVRIWGFDTIAFRYVKLAQDEGLDVWLQFHPLYSYPDISVDEYKSRLSDFAQKAKEYNVKVLFVGNEMDLWWKKMGGCPTHNCDDYNARKSGKLSSCINDLIGIARQKFNGKVTYAEWGALWGILDWNIPWSKMDIISSNIYIQEGATEEKFYNSIFNAKSIYTKPFIISETGSQTYREAEQAGGDYTYLLRFDVHYDPYTQANVIDKELRLIFSSNVSGVFIYCWDADVSHSAGDMNKLGFGIWDYIVKEPKPSFWSVYKYFKE